MPKLGLGTVQFGMDYGITNDHGRIPEKEVAEILSIADESGITLLDTAHLYGNSEEVLGTLINRCNNFDIITKTPRFNNKTLTRADADLLEEAYLESLRKLQITSAYGLLIHNCEDLINDHNGLLWESMLKMKEKGLVEKIGVSIYTSEQIDAILDRYPIDLVQLPINVFDQRLLQSGHLAKLKNAGIEIHGRSVFLQGLLLMDPKKLGPHFYLIKKILGDYLNLLKQFRLTPVEGALNFAKNISMLDAIIVGVYTSRHLKEICQAFATKPTEIDYSMFALSDPDIIDPSKWPIK